MNRQSGGCAFLSILLCVGTVIPALAGESPDGVVIHRAGGGQIGGAAFIQAPSGFQMSPGYVGSVGWGDGLTRTPERAERQHQRFHEHQQYHHEQFHEHQQFHDAQSGTLYDWSDSQFSPDAQAGWPATNHSASGQGYQQLQQGWDNINQRSYYYYGPSR